MEDEEGYLHALLLDGHGGASQLDPAQLAGWNAGKGPLWVHLDYSIEASRCWLDTGSGIDPLVAAALQAEETRPRVEVLHGGVLVVLRGVNRNPGADPEDMVSVRLWVEPERVISTLQRGLDSVTEVGRELAVGTGPTTATEVLVELTRKLTVAAADVIEDLVETVDELEDELLSGQLQRLRAVIGETRRRAIALRRYLAPQRDAILRLTGERAAPFAEIERRHLREVADMLTRYVEDLDAARERAAVCQEELNNRLSEQVGRRMYLLAMITAVFLPLTFVTGLFGINVGGIPGSEDPRAFGLFAVGLVVAALGIVLLFRWRRWL